MRSFKQRHDMIASVRNCSIKLLYISFDGMLEPLGQSQVLSYLLEMKKKDPRLDIFLLSYEKSKDWNEEFRRKTFEDRMKASDIRWTPLRYHRYPRLLASGFDLGKGFLWCLYLSIRYRIQIVHTRSLMAAFFGFGLKRLLKLQWVFDMRGFWADEKVDGGLWARSSFKYRLLQKTERCFVQTADQVVTLTKASLPYLKRSAVVIPTCVSLERFFKKKEEALSITALQVGYVGSVSFSYDFAPALLALKEIKKLKSEVSFVFLNRDQPDFIERALEQEGMLECSIVKSVNYDQIPSELSKMTAAVFFIKPTFAKVASCPTKLGELLAMGIPVLTNSGIGDVEEYLTKTNVGICISDMSVRAIEAGVRRFLGLLEDPEVSDRCRKAAEDIFSLAKGSAEYLKTYSTLLEGS